jgi:L-2-hydroxycarboxylate dehydrogenase (NAD+)
MMPPAPAWTPYDIAGAHQLTRIEETAVSGDQRVSPAELHAFIARALRTQGLPEQDLQTVARLMAEADLQGSDGHGVIRLGQYIKRIQAGGINTQPTMRIEREKAAIALLDGDNAMGHLVVSRAVDIAAAKARNTGVAWVGMRMSNHAGPASLYVRTLAEQNLIGLYMAVGNANHLPPWGGMDMLLSTNPVAIAFPKGHQEDLMVLDMATTVAAYGKVKAKARKGEMMPEGWMIDRQGNALLDPRRAAEGFLLPIGGHKGYGLALMVGMLAGSLNGASMGREVIDFNADHQSITNTGQMVCALDPEAFGSLDDLRTRIDQLAADIRSSTRLPKVERIWLPGEQSNLRKVSYQQSGIPVSEGVMTELAQIAEELGIERLRML